MSKEYKKLLEEILNAEGEGDITPESRIEAYLLALCEKMSGGNGGGGSGLPQVVLTTFSPSTEPAPLTEEENAALNAVAELKIPIIASISIAIGTTMMMFSSVFNYSEQSQGDMSLRLFTGEVSLEGEDSMTSIIASLDGSTWMTMIIPPQ